MLTAHLDNPASPVRRYIESVTPLISDAAGSSKDARTAKQLLGIDDLPALVTANHPEANPGTVGSAYNYMVRLLLDRCEPRKFVAALGAAGVIALTAGRAKPLIEPFFSGLEAFLDQAAPARRDLSGPELSALARYCVVLAMLESVFRTKTLFWDLPSPAPGPDGPALAAIANPSAVDAVVTLTTATSDTWAGWRPQVAEGGPYVPNPTFAGSPAVGGADADFVLNGELLEMKTVQELTAATARKALTQAVGYALFDWDDENGIRSVGVSSPGTTTGRYGRCGRCCPPPT